MKMSFENTPQPKNNDKEQLPYVTPENKAELIRVTKEIHSVHPDIVLFTMTSAFNIAVALKEVWKNAYPSEEPPLFYSVNPHGLESEDVQKDFHGKMKQLNRGGDLNNKKILVFDEYKGDPEYGAFRVPVQYNDQMRASNTRLEQATIMMKDFIGNGANIYALGADGPRFNGNLFGAEATNVFSRLHTPEVDYHKNIVRNVHSKAGLELMEKLKEIGREAGYELHESNKSGE